MGWEDHTMFGHVFSRSKGSNPHGKCPWKGIIQGWHWKFMLKDSTEFTLKLPKDLEKLITNGQKKH